MDFPGSRSEFARFAHQQDARQLAHVADILRRFYEAQLSLSSLQPVLDLAVELNPALRVRRAPTSETRNPSAHLGAVEG
jgi:hypothetical protein